MEPSLADVPNPAVPGTTMPLHIKCVAAVPETQRYDNVRVNIERKTIRFLSLPGLLCSRAEPLALVGGGPSVKTQLDKIRGFRQILACGSAHDYLIENGIIPAFALSVDPAEETLKYYKNIHKDVSYIIASQCPPVLFDRLEKHGCEKVCMWHYKGQIDEKSVFKGEHEIGWGCMVGVLSLHIALFLGFQHLHFFGFDCSYDGADTHAYRIGQEEYDFIRTGQSLVTVGQGTKQYMTTTALIMQASHFMRVFESDDGSYLEGTIHGDGLLAEIVRQSPPEMSEWLKVA